MSPQQYPFPSACTAHVCPTPLCIVLKDGIVIVGDVDGEAVGCAVGCKVGDRKVGAVGFKVVGTVGTPDGLIVVGVVGDVVGSGVGSVGKRVGAMTVNGVKLYPTGGDVPAPSSP